MRASAAAVWIALFSLAPMYPANLPPPPTTARKPVTDQLHGVSLTDPYRWLEDQQSPETRAWIGAQQKYTRGLLDPLPGREKLRNRVTELIRLERLSTPVERNNRYFLLKRGRDEEQFSIYFRQGSTGADQLLVDAKALSKDHSTSVYIQGVSDDGKLLAYAIQKGGKDERSIKVMDVTTREHLRDELPEGKWGSVAFTPDKKRFFYSTWGTKNPRVKVHTMDTPYTQDREVFGEGYGEQYIPECDLSEDGRYLLIVMYLGSSADVNELFVKDLKTDAPPRLVNRDIKAAFSGDVYNGRLYMATNWKAARWRILSMPVDDPDPKNWKEIVPEGKGVIESMRVAGGQLLVSYLENVTSRLEILSLEGKPERTVQLPAKGVVKSIIARPSSQEAFFLFNSMHIPQEIYRLDIGKASTTLWYKLSAPIDRERFTVDQVWYESTGGVKVPMFLLYKKGLKRDGGNPTILYGYGGFNVSVTPDFSATAVAWAEQGGIYGIANLRGGGEFGESWHQAGMLANKQNVFDDFANAGRYLIREKYTTSAKLAVMGGSNGGLLVGALLTQHPDLARAVVCTFPLLDMIRFHKFLVAKFWVPEYGSSEDAKQFEYILKYSPYQNVKPGTKYPGVMIVTGDFDTRVDPLHGRKMAALLQASTGSAYPVLLHYDTQAGHSGGLSATKSIDNTVDYLSFIAWQLGVTLH